MTTNYVQSPGRYNGAANATESSQLRNISGHARHRIDDPNRQNIGPVVVHVSCKLRESIFLPAW